MITKKIIGNALPSIVTIEQDYPSFDNVQVEMGGGRDFLWSVETLRANPWKTIIKYNVGDGEEGFKMFDRLRDDELHFGKGIDANKCGLFIVGSDLILTTGNNSDSLRFVEILKDSMLQVQNFVSKVVFDNGVTFDTEQIKAAALTVKGENTNDVLTFKGWQLGLNLTYPNQVFFDGGNGNDTIIGNVGTSEIIIGGGGTDKMTGAVSVVGFEYLNTTKKADTFKFASFSDLGLGSSRDIITDFNITVGDKIDLSSLDANPFLGGRQAFMPVGTPPLQGNGLGKIWFDNGVLNLSTDYDSMPEYQIELLGVNQFLSAEPLIL